VRGAIEHPLARQHLRPGVGHADAADLPKEDQTHSHLVAAGKTQRLQRDLHFHDIAVRGGLRRTEPDEVGVELLPGRGGVERVHLAAARIREQVIGRLAGAVQIGLIATSRR
jgi:hypothetical protein